MALSPDANLQPGDRVSLPVEVVNDIHALLMELPAGRSMDLILAIRQHAERVPDENDALFAAMARGDES